MDVRGIEFVAVHDITHIYEFVINCRFMEEWTGKKYTYTVFYSKPASGSLS